MKIRSEQNKNLHTICGNKKLQKKHVYSSEVIPVMDNRVSHITQKKEVDMIKKTVEMSNYPICQFEKNIDGKEIPAKLYHVTTPANWALIQASGLGFKDRKLWLSSTKSSAVSGSANILLEVDTTGIPADKIRLANDYIEGYGDDKVWIIWGRLKISRIIVIS